MNFNSYSFILKVLLLLWKKRYRITSWH